MNLLEARGITKSFAGVRALRDVSLDLAPGEVHALVGENGAGKSTLVKIITGAHTPDAGTLTLFGKAIDNLDPASARSLGIAAIYQQPALFPHLSVAENIAWTLEETRAWRRVDWRTRHTRAVELLDRAGAPIDPERLASELSLPEQQIVEIAKAIGAEAKILIMDEPTASLGQREVESLFQVIARLRAEGVAILYISHRLEEISAIADRITVLRDGETIRTLQKGEANRPELISLMAGRELAAIFPERRHNAGDVVLELRNISSRASDVHDVSLELRQGEIHGLAGLVGSGRTELAEIVFGLRHADSGQIFVNGAAVRVASPSHAIRLGIAYAPEDRRQHGVIGEMTVAHNMSLANLAAVSRRGWINENAEQSLAERYVTQFRVKTPSVETTTGLLSGGNQQKVALARWLATQPSILILDEPTQGVDVGSKAEIHALIAEMADRGLAILMISSDLPEILGMSERIAVMHRGTICAVLSRDEATQERILSLALEGAHAC